MCGSSILNDTSFNVQGLKGSSDIVNSKVGLSKDKSQITQTRVIPSSDNNTKFQK